MHHNAQGEVIKPLSQRSRGSSLVGIGLRFLLFPLSSLAAVRSDRSAEDIHARRNPVLKAKVYLPELIPQQKDLSNG